MSMRASDLGPFWFWSRASKWLFIALMLNTYTIGKSASSCESLLLAAVEFQATLAGAIDCSGRQPEASSTPSWWPTIMREKATASIRLSRTNPELIRLLAHLGHNDETMQWWTFDPEQMDTSRTAIIVTVFGLLISVGSFIIAFITSRRQRQKYDARILGGGTGGPAVGRKFKFALFNTGDKPFSVLSMRYSTYDVKLNMTVIGEEFFKGGFNDPCTVSPGAASLYEFSISEPVHFHRLASGVTIQIHNGKKFSGAIQELKDPNLVAALLFAGLLEPLRPYADLQIFCGRVDRFRSLRFSPKDTLGTTLQNNGHFDLALDRLTIEKCTWFSYEMTQSMEYQRMFPIAQHLINSVPKVFFCDDSLSNDGKTLIQNLKVTSGFIEFLRKAELDIDELPNWVSGGTFDKTLADRMVRFLKTQMAQ